MPSSLQRKNFSVFFLNSSYENHDEPINPLATNATKKNHSATNNDIFTTIRNNP